MASKWYAIIWSLLLLQFLGVPQSAYHIAYLFHRSLKARIVARTVGVSLSVMYLLLFDQ